MSKNNKRNNKYDRKRQIYAIIGLILAATMLLTTLVSAFFIY